MDLFGAPGAAGWHPGSGSVNGVAALKRQVENLKREIERLKGSQKLPS